MKKNIKIVIADDRRLLTDGLKSLLAQSTCDYEFRVIGMVENSEDLVEIFKRHQPDLLMLNLRLGEKTDITKALSNIQSQLNGAKIIALPTSEEFSPTLQQDAARYGVTSFLSKYCGAKDCIFAINEVLLGRTYRHSSATESVEVSKNNPQQAKATFIKKSRLTAREVQILELIGKAKGNKEIGKELFISDQTVAVHRKNIMRKLNVNNTPAILKLAYDNNMV